MQFLQTSAGHPGFVILADSHEIIFHMVLAAESFYQKCVNAVFPTDNDDKMDEDILETATNGERLRFLLREALVMENEYNILDRFITDLGVGKLTSDESATIKKSLDIYQEKVRNRVVKLKERVKFHSLRIAEEIAAEYPKIIVAIENRGSRSIIEECIERNGLFQTFLKKKKTDPREILDSVVALSVLEKAGLKARNDSGGYFLSAASDYGNVVLGFDKAEWEKIHDAIGAVGIINYKKFDLLREFEEELKKVN